MMHRIQMVEQWISFLLLSPVPEVGNSRVELSLYPNSNSTKFLTFALPDNTRFSLCDFPLHLSLELLGVSKCLQVSPMILSVMNLHLSEDNVITGAYPHLA